MRVRVLGPLEVSDSAEWRRVGSAKQRALLASLVVHAGVPVSVDRLVEEIWNGRPPMSAVNLVQGYVLSLRRRLGDPDGVLLRTQPPGYQLVLTEEELDVGRFEALVEQGRRALADGDNHAASDLVAEALQLWRGQPFADVAPTAAVEAEANRLEQLRLAGLEVRNAAGLALGRHAALVPELQTLTRTHPLVEQFWAQLMLALYRSGRQAEALAAYRQLHTLLDDELGIEPTPPVRDLHQQILTGHAALDPAPSAPGRGTGPTRGSVAVPRQLPAGISNFTGRQHQLAQLDALLPDQGAPPAPAVPIAAITGTAGIGKTALAVHWAHRIAHRFPDGQLYVNLRGFDPLAQPVSATEAVRGFLDALGVAPEQIPVELEAQTARYRSLLADRRILVVLDNARDADQVRPLLPGSPTCLALITSRNQLESLVATEAARPVQLDQLSNHEAHALLAARLGNDRLAAEPDAANTIITSCARLPLALAIATARAATHPGFPLATLATELADTRTSLEPFTAGDTATDLRAVFSWSYKQLNPETQHLFRLLGLHPGPDITAPAAASLAGVPDAEARKLLAELSRVHLLTQHQFGRYSFHDLLRAYSSDLAHAVDTEATRSDAIRRMLDHYLHTAFSAAKFVEPARLLIPLPPSSVASKVFVDRDQATGWFAAEDQVLVAAVQLAAAAGFDSHAWQLVWCLAPVHDLLARWQDQVTMFQLALEAATRARDLFGQAHAHCGLGVAHTRLGHWAQALPELQQAIELFRGIGDSASQAHGHYVVSAVLARLGHRQRANSHVKQAIELFQHTNQPIMQARALDLLGWAHAGQGNHQDALQLCQQALEIQQELGDRTGAASTWDTLGHIHHLLGHYDQAAACFRQAIAGYQELGDPFHQADALCDLGDTHQAVGATDAAVKSWRAALHLLEEIGHERAKEVRTRLAAVAKAQ
jgi:DNA-binding SARP family transcriptional activator